MRRPKHSPAEPARATVGNPMRCRKIYHFPVNPVALVRFIIGPHERSNFAAFGMSISK